MKSKTFIACQAQGHTPFYHSPDGVEKIAECSVCCMAWLLKLSGEVIRLHGKIELRLARQSTECCFYCGEPVNLHDSGVTYANGKCAHDSCHDANEFEKANAGDFRD